MEKKFFVNGVNVIKYEPDLNDNIESLKTAKRVREKLEKELAKPVKKTVLKKQVDELLKRLEGEFAL
jgi:hypothetical protein